MAAATRWDSQTASMGINSTARRNTSAVTVGSTVTHLTAGMTDPPLFRGHREGRAAIEPRPGGAKEDSESAKRMHRQLSGSAAVPAPEPHGEVHESIRTYLSIPFSPTSSVTNRSAEISSRSSGGGGGGRLNEPHHRAHKHDSDVDNTGTITATTTSSTTKQDARAPIVEKADGRAIVLDTILAVGDHDSICSPNSVKSPPPPPPPPPAVAAVGAGAETESPAPRRNKAHASENPELDRSGAVPTASTEGGSAGESDVGRGERTFSAAGGAVGAGGVPEGVPEGVVIRVMISGAHTSFLHMRVFPSTTAGQVCRKIGERLRQSQVEQADYCLIAVYARPAAAAAEDAACTAGGTGMDVADAGGYCSADEGTGGGGVGRRAGKGTGISVSLHGGGRRVAAGDSRHRQRKTADRNASVRHVLHTFRPEERLGEHRLGLPPPPPLSSPTTEYPTPPNRRTGGEGESYVDRRNRGGGISFPKEGPDSVATGAAAAEAAAAVAIAAQSGGKSAGQSVGSSLMSGGSSSSTMTMATTTAHGSSSGGGSADSSVVDGGVAAQHQGRTAVRSSDGRGWYADDERGAASVPERGRTNSGASAEAAAGAAARKSVGRLRHRVGEEKGRGGGGGEGELKRAPSPAAAAWKSRWIYRDSRASALEADELQVEVSGSDTSEDEARAGWTDLTGLGQGHYSGYLLKKSNRDANLWRRRWCILAGDKLWLLRSKSEQSGRRRRGRSHSYPLSLVPCKSKEVSRGAVPSHCFELHTGTRTHVFRAESRAKQVVWVNSLQRQARQAEEDSYISLAEHMVCDEEYARCRRLNSILSKALGKRPCVALDRAGYAAGLGIDHGFTAGFGGGTTNNNITPTESDSRFGEGTTHVSGGGGGGVGGVRGATTGLSGEVFVPPPLRSAPSSSGLFRRAPPPTPPTARQYAGNSSPSPSAQSEGKRRFPLVGDGGSHSIAMVREVSAAAAAGGGGGGVDEAGLLVLSAGQVKRGLRFCMKVHRFREMCRGGSCVTVWKRWAIAADALEELYPGLSDRGPGLLAANATSLACGHSSSSGCESSGGEGVGHVVEGDAEGRHSLVLSRNSSSGSAASTEARCASNVDTTHSINLDDALPPAVQEADSEDVTTAASVSVPEGSSSISTECSTIAKPHELQCSETPVETAATAAAAGSTNESASTVSTIPTAILTSLPTISAMDPSGAGEVFLPAATTNPAPTDCPDPGAIPIVTAQPMSVAANDTRSGLQPTSHKAVRPPSSFAQPRRLATAKSLGDVSLAIQHYRASVASARSHGLVSGGNGRRSGGALGTAERLSVGGDLGGGGGDGGGGLNTRGQRERFPEDQPLPLDLTPQESDMPPAAPPETLLDALLDEVLESLGDT